MTPLGASSSMDDSSDPVTEQTKTDVSAYRMNGTEDALPSNMKTTTKAPTKAELARIGETSQLDRIMDKDANPDCPKCGGTGSVFLPDRTCSGYVCPCTMERR